MEVISNDGRDLWVLLPCGQKTVINSEDKWIIETFPRWGSTCKNKKYVYVERSIDTGFSVIKERITLHRLIAKMSAKISARMEVDHKDRNSLNNRRNNLRVATKSQNQANVGPRKNRFFKGVYKITGRKNPSKPFRSIMRGNSIKMHLGYFKTAEEAARAYDKKAKEIYGEFACLNFE